MFRRNKIRELPSDWVRLGCGKMRFAPVRSPKKCSE